MIITANMSKLTREEYIDRTLKLAEDSSSEAYRAKYWELAGRALGFLEAPKIENQSVAIFQAVSGEMMAFLKEKLPDFSKLPSEEFIKIENGASDGDNGSKN